VTAGPFALLARLLFARLASYIRAVLPSKEQTAQRTAIDSKRRFTGDEAFVGSEA
jgi:hypothetical protein